MPQSIKANTITTELVLYPGSRQEKPLQEEAHAHS